MLSVTKIYHKSIAHPITNPQTYTTNLSTNPMLILITLIIKLTLKLY